MIDLKKIVLNTVLGLIIFLIGYLGMNYIFERPSPKLKIQDPETKNIIVDSLLVVVDSLTVQVDSLHRTKNKINMVFVPQKVDTALIIAQYFKTYRYTIAHRDKDLDLKLNFDLLQNKVQSPKLEFKVLKPTTVYECKTKKENHLFFGTSLGGSLYSLDQFTPEIIFFTGKQGFKIGYNLLDQNRNLQIGYYFKIK